jgi:hypothetical protein
MQGEDYGNEAGSHSSGSYAEPSPEEIMEYAAYLGMDLENDKDLLYIAEKGLKAPVPEPWVTMENENDDIYYLNPVTSEVLWQHPLDTHYRNLYIQERDKKRDGGAARASGGAAKVSSDPILNERASQILNEKTAQLEEEMAREI